MNHDTQHLSRDGGVGEDVSLERRDNPRGLDAQRVDRGEHNDACGYDVHLDLLREYPRDSGDAQLVIGDVEQVDRSFDRRVEHDLIHQRRQRRR